MDSMSTKLCRLCLEASDEMLNIFENSPNPTISSILTKHFWFQVDRNDGMPEWLCEICWIQTKTFHHFYRRVEIRHGNYRSPTNLVKKITIKQERSESPSEEQIDSRPDLEIVKQEEAELPAQTTDQLVVKEEYCEYDAHVEDYNDADSLAESGNSETSDEDDQPFNIKSKSHDTEDTTTAAAGTSTLNIERIDSNSRSGPKLVQQDAQIREFFTMKCEICTDDIRFETLSKARQHYRNVHNKKGYLMCCGNKFHSRYRILVHIRFHMNPDAYRCVQCDKSFKDIRALKTHTDNHVPHERPYECGICKSTFTKATSLKVHVQNIHSSVTGEMLPCEKCSKTFRSPTSLASHIRSVHEFSLDHVCEVCARRFKSKQLLKSHIFSEHSRTAKAQCEKCGAWLKHKLSLRRHLKRCQQSNCEPLNCSICDKVVPNRTALLSHISNAHGARSHQCTFCDKAFKTPKSLKEHTSIHTGEYLYECSYCDKKFKSNANMYSHRKKIHLEEWARDRTYTLTAQNKSEEAATTTT